MAELLANRQNESEIAQAFASSLIFSGIQLESERGRRDASYNNVILEYKDYGYFKGSDRSSKFLEATNQLKRYIQSKAIEDGEEQSYYIGIATDAKHIAFCSVEDDEVSWGPLLPLNEAACEKLLKTLQGANHRTLTTSNLIDDFGHCSDVGKQLMSALSNELTLHFNQDKNNKIKMLFREWKELFGQVSGLTTEKRRKIRSEVSFDAPNLVGMGKEKEDYDIAGLLFVIHTYNALIMKLLGAEIVSNIGFTQYRDFCDHISAQGDSLLLNTLKVEIEGGKLFENAGIKGFVEEALFSWYLDITLDTDKREVASAIRKAATQLSLYRMDYLTAARSRDVLKGLYQALVPDVLRKSLGEFYTPDWLVEHTTVRAQVTDWIGSRVLDPTCGSGSFLLNALNRKKEAAHKESMGPEATVDMLLDTVWGFDLNPLAVQAARVNYLIAISDLLKECGSKEVELPILLADSVYSPARELLTDKKTISYKVGSKVANLNVTFPRELIKQRVKLDHVFSVIGNGIERDDTFGKIVEKLRRQKVIEDSEIDLWQDYLYDAYSQVMELHRNNWNGIWFRIIRNFFWTTVAGKFDVVLGNPPWVRWSALPEDYREKVKETCEAYEIFSDTKFYGGNELDISGMIAYTVADTWLKADGVMAFVMPQNHFQTPSSQGFRSFRINSEFSLIPTLVDDLKALKPFSAANKTAVVCFKKSAGAPSNLYPVGYNLWSAKEGFSKTINEYETLDSVLKRVTVEQNEANPVGDERSPWAIMAPHRFELCKSIRGESKWVNGRKGVTADLNGIYMVEVLEVDDTKRQVKIRTRPEAGKKDIGPVSTFWVEPDLLYPLVKGAGDFSSCYFKPKKELFIFVPNKGITKQALLDAEEIVENDLPKTFRYFNMYKSLLQDRSTYKLRLSKYDFYHIYNVGSYSFSPYKVIWAEQSGCFSSVVVSKSEVPLIGERTYVPDHKIYFVDIYDELEAYYLCGLLCAPIVKEYIESHTISIQVSNIFKHMDLPCYDVKNQKHKALSVIVKDAHECDDPIKRNTLISKLGVLAEQIIMS